jgi:hypothetical protein
MFRGIFDLLHDKEQELRISRDYIETLRRYWIARTQTEQLLMGRLYDTGYERMENAKAGDGASGNGGSQRDNRFSGGQRGRGEGQSGGNQGGGE